MNTQTNFKYIMRQNYTKEGVLIVTLPLKGFGAMVLSEGDKYIFINSKLPKATRSELINEGLKRHRDGLKGKVLVAE